jgi:hypothetical protein
VPSMKRIGLVCSGWVAQETSTGQVRRILHEEFVRWFGEGTAGSEEAYEQPALRSWEAVTEFRRTA